MTVLLAVLAVSSPALAQVNAESLRPNPLRAGWSGGVEGSFALSRGNIELLDIGGGGRVQYQTLHPLPPSQEGVSAPLPYIAQRVFLTGTTLPQGFVIRVCVLSFRTHADRVDALVEDVRAALADLGRA